MWSSLKVFFATLPEIISLVKYVIQLVREAETEKDLKESSKQISDAFKERDAQKLNDIFNNIGNGVRRKDK